MNTFRGLSSAPSSLRLLVEAASRCSPKSPNRIALRCFTTCEISRSRAYSGSFNIISGIHKVPYQKSPRRIAVRTFFGSKIITNYVELPANYADEVGIPFQSKEFEQHDVIAVFGTGMSVPAANRLLSVLHGRRVAGTLQDPALRPNTAHFTKAQQDAALQYLRRKVPVDEVINAGLRAEDELRALEDPEIMEADRAEMDEEAHDEDAATLKKQANLDKNNKWKSRIFKDSQPNSDVYGKSAFDEIRERNEAKWEEEQKRRAAEQKLKEEEEAKANPGGLQKIDMSKSREMSPRMKGFRAAATSSLKEPPKMSKWQRLWPSYLFAISVLLGGTVFAMDYEPPLQHEREFPDIPPAAATLIALIGVNVAVYLWWKVPHLWPLLNRYFIMTPATPRPVSLFGAAFSHQTLSHLFFNMVWLWFVGTRLHDEVGRASFLELYFASASLGFLASLTGIVLRNQLHLTSLGASGAVYGVGTAYFMIHKFDGFKILGLPPDPFNGVQGLGFIALFLGLNVAGLIGLRKKKQVVDLICHLGGMAVGAVYGQYFYMVKQEKKKAKNEGREERSVFKVMTSEKLATKRAKETAEKIAKESS